MEQVVASFPEHHGQLLIVVCHGLGNWKLLGQVHQPMNVLNGLVCLLQQGVHQSYTEAVPIKIETFSSF